RLSMLTIRHASPLCLCSHHTLHTPPPSTLFPYTTLFRSGTLAMIGKRWRVTIEDGPHSRQGAQSRREVALVETTWVARHRLTMLDRKSTRLNSSHVSISYAVFCFIEKKNVR